MPVSGSNMVAAGDAYSAYIETVLDDIPRLFEQTKQLSGLIGPGKNVTIGDRFARGPMLKWVGGTFQSYNPDGGVVGTGSGLAATSFTVGYFYSNYGVQVSHKAMDVSKGSGVSKIDIFATQQSEALTEIAVYEDICLHTDGTGLLTNASSNVVTNAGGDTMTFAGANDTLGINLLREGMAVAPCAVGAGYVGNVPLGGLANGSVSDVGGALRANATKAGYPGIITNIDYDNRKITLDSTFTGLTTGDRLQIVGLLMQPATAGSSGYPGAPGVVPSWTSGTDSFRHGIPYANQVDTTLYYNTINRATFNQINPVAYNLQGAPITANHVLIIRDRQTQRRDPSVLQGQFGICHMSVRASAMNIGISVSEWQRDSANNQPLLDLMPKNIGYEDSFVLGGMTHYLTKRQPRDRVDYFNPKLWGRAEVFPGPRPLKWGDTFLMPTLNSSGQYTAGLQMFWQQAFDWFCQDPGAQMVIYNANIPTGYTVGT